MAQSDPIASLHKMSPTAGAANQEYVAINSLAIASVVFSILGAFAILTKVLLVLPLVAAVCAVLAIRQIRRSAGTQTGIGVAAFGLVVSLGISGFVLARAQMRYFQEQRDGEEINGVLQEVGQALHDAFPQPGQPPVPGALAKAYNQFSGKFQSQFDPHTFTMRMVQFNALGRIRSIKWNGICHWAGEAGDDYSTAQTMAVITFEHEERGPDGVMHPVEVRYPVVCRHGAGASWKIDAIPELFRPPKPPNSAD